VQELTTLCHIRHFPCSVCQSRQRGGSRGRESSVFQRDKRRSSAIRGGGDGRPASNSATLLNRDRAAADAAHSSARQMIRKRCRGHGSLLCCGSGGFCDFKKTGRCHALRQCVASGKTRPSARMQTKWQHFGFDDLILPNICEFGYITLPSPPVRRRDFPTQSRSRRSSGRSDSRAGISARTRNGSRARRCSRRR